MNGPFIRRRFTCVPAVVLHALRVAGTTAASLMLALAVWATPKLIAANLLYIHISPPQSGVKLIEEVFQRVRSSPEIAMTHLLQRQQELQNMMAQKDKLAIRPKQPGQVMLQPSPSLQLVAQAPMNQSLPASNPQTRSSNAFGVFAARQAEPSSNADRLSTRQAPEPSPQASPPPAPVIDAWMGAKHLPSDEVMAQRQTGFWDRTAIERDKAVNCSQEALDEKGAQLAASDGNRDLGSPRPLPMATAARQQAAAAASKPAKLGAAIAKMVALGNTIDRATSGDLASAAASVNLESLKKTETVAYGPAVASGGAFLHQRSGYAVHGTLQGMRFARPTSQSAMTSPAKDDIESVPFLAHQRRLALSQSNLAVLPPNVFTGIPLMRLGVPESQVSSALNSLGTTRQQRVDNWLVVSWQKNSTKNQTALQLYVRNGLLDAMRIFDPTLIGPEFGINVGAGLTQVKEKFGEPAFILTEPGPGAGKNYIYPISQVGFQLVPGQPGEEPRVASVLLFNVK